MKCVVAAARAGTLPSDLEPAARRARGGLEVGFHRRRHLEPADVHRAARAADHVEVEHGDGVLDRDDRMAGVVRRSEQAAFLAGKRDEDQRAREARRARSAAARAISMIDAVPDALSSAPL